MSGPLVLAPPFDAAARERLARAMADGEVMAYPTETHYALGGNALDAALCARIHELKGRPAEKALLLLIDGEPMLGRFAGEIAPPARVLAERFWPGPLTLVVPAGPALPAHLAHEGTVALRHSPHPVPRELLALGGVPLIGTSANRGGEPPADTLDAVLAAFPDAVSLAVDDGPTAGGAPSTLVDTTVKPFRILREGALAKALIQAVLVETFIEYVPD